MELLPADRPPHNVRVNLTLRPVNSTWVLARIALPSGASAFSYDGSTYNKDTEP